MNDGPGDGSTASVHRRDIDGLRAVAVGALVALHAFPSVLAGGFTGVDVFCPEDQCAALDDGQRLPYADDNHLSEQGSAFAVKRGLSGVLRPRAASAP